MIRCWASAFLGTDINHEARDLERQPSAWLEYKSPASVATVLIRFPRMLPPGLRTRLWTRIVALEARLTATIICRCKVLHLQLCESRCSTRFAQRSTHSPRWLGLGPERDVSAFYKQKKTCGSTAQAPTSLKSLGQPMLCQKLKLLFPESCNSLDTRSSWLQVEPCCCSRMVCLARSHLFQARLPNPQHELCIRCY